MRDVSDVHLGDWGLQMGQLINEVKLEQPGLPYFDESVHGPYPETSPVTMDDLSRLYPPGVGQVEDGRGAAGGRPQGDRGAAGGAARIQGAVAALLRCHARGAGARVRKPRRRRSTSGRARATPNR